MNILKGLALSVLGLLLFFSLSIFGLAFTLNQTFLNPDFVVDELDRLDVPALAGEVLREQISKGELPEEFGKAMVDTVTELAPSIKEQIGAATYSIYHYLRGKSQSLDLAVILSDTILSRDFVVSLIDKLDISALAGEFIKEQIAGEIPEGMEYLVEPLEDVINELEPELKQQLSAAADPILDYLLGKRQSLNVVISLEPVKGRLGETIKEALLQSPPPPLAGMSPAMIEQFFDQFYPQLAAQIPSTFAINESVLGTEAPAEFAQALAEAELALAQAREYAGYVLLAYNISIGVILFLILCIVLIHRNVRGSTRSLGSIFLTYGIFEYISILIIKNYIGPQVGQAGVPFYLEGWLLQFLKNLLAPLEMLSLGLLIGGIVLLVVSFVYRREES